MKRIQTGFLAAAAVFAASAALAQGLGLSDEKQPLRFAVIGDSGTGGKQQREIALQMVRARERVPFEFVLMLGDNIYGGETPRDYQEKFERPYAALLEAGVRFYAALGNHDEMSQRFYPLFNMKARGYYAFAPREDVRMIALNSSRMDSAQLTWLTEEMARPASDWSLVFMHHPLYSSGKRHGPSLRLQELLQPLFRQGGVSVVFAGHEHFYERQKPQNGIHYFISGAAAKLRKGNIVSNSETACGFDRDNSFMLVQLTENELRFETIARDGSVVDAGTIYREAPEAGPPSGCSPQPQDAGFSSSRP